MNMRLLRLFLLILSIILVSLQLHGADLDKFMLRGYIYGENYIPVDSVEFSLLKNDTIKVKFKILTSNINGNIITGSQLRAMVNSGIGDYTATFYKEGYMPLVKNFRISSVSENVKYLQGIFMKKESVVQLGEVTVTSTRVKMVMKGDTIVFDAAAFNLAEGSMLDALVRQLPGATLSSDGVITVNGRKINELLVNGKDFFKGDPKVALQNLPAYTVKDLKVYDKAAEDAYLTHSNARLTKREDEENLVLDVQLKKEYDTGWLANVEGGYGTDRRYLGRLFALGYTDRLRIAVFGNTNNTGNQSQAGDSGQWYEMEAENGLLKVLMSGIDYNYKDNKRIEITGNVNYHRIDNHTQEISSSTRFYPSGDLYRKSMTVGKDLSQQFDTQHDFRFKGDNIFVSFSPLLSWNKLNNKNIHRSATFSTEPHEEYRGQALDSIFSSNSMSQYRDAMLTALQTMSVNDPQNLRGSFSADATLAPKNWRGRLRGSINGSVGKNDFDLHRYYQQSYGEASESAAKPVNQDNYTVYSAKSHNIGADLKYTQSVRKFGEIRTTSLNYSVAAGYSYNYSNNDSRLFADDSLPSPLTPPSLVRPENLLLDYMNSPYTDHSVGRFNGSVSLSYSSEPTSPGDSTFNPTFNVGLNARYRYSHEKYNFVKQGITDQHLKRDNNFITPSVNMSFSSTNNSRNLGFYLSYSLNRTAPEMSYLLDNRNSSDPLNVFLGNPDGLKNETTHSVNFGMYRFNRGKGHSYIQFYGSWSCSVNGVAYAQTYNPVTGVNINRPANISGNWDTNLGSSYSMNLGSRDEFSLSLSLDASVRNSADYLGLDTIPTRSSVLNMTFRPEFCVGYQFKNGSTISTGFRSTVESQKSKREGFNNLTWCSYRPFLHLFLKLPAEIDFNTQFNPYFRRGMTDREMNTSELVWNATVSKAFGKSGFALKLSVKDILGSSKHIYTTVNAQGRTETWRMAMPRYVLLTAVYRFDMKPRI